jgi:uncharacterized protein
MKMSLKSLLTALSLAAVSVHTYGQTYTGTLSCGVSLSAAARPAFESPAELVVKNGTARMKRSSERFEESLEGRVSGQQLSLEGQGKSFTGDLPWTTKLQGTIDGKTFKGRGEIITSKGEKYRECQVAMVNTSKPIEQPAPAQAPALVVPKPVPESVVIASFDCQKAASKTEKMICSNQLTGKLDVALTNAYRKTLASSDNSNDVRSEQVSWLSSVRDKCDNSDCLDNAYAARIKALEGRKTTSIVQSPIATTSPVEMPVIVESKQNVQMQPLKGEQTGSPAIEEKVAQQAVHASTQPEKSSRELAREKWEKEREVESAKYAAQNQIEQAKRKSEEKLLYGGGGILAVIAAWFWNKFIRNRCPKCKSTNFETTGTEEVDRWRGTKVISPLVKVGGHNSGSYTRKDKQVAVTYVKKAYSYRCRACQNEWVVQKKEEL